MMTDHCGASQLDDFLDGTLTAQAEIEVTRHLDQCTQCARELEQRAAAQSRWDDAKALLSDSVAGGIQTLHKDHSTDLLPLSVRQVLDMLDPTDDPGYMGRIGGYEIIGVVGSGAMGVVLKAADRSLDRIVALKVMNPSLASCGTARQRFAREAKAAAGVLHPNVIAIHGVSTDHALPYLVMPYVKGSSLKQRLDQQGPLSLTEILRIGGQVAAGLAAAHHQGLIHRDIKPSNIMLDSGVETAVITDFGLARTIDDATMTRSGAITGTPEFMSPEQARGDTVDCNSDVFSLGSVLYALCTGQRPFRARTSFGVLRTIVDENPTPIRDINPDIPDWFCRIVANMHAKSPAERRSSAEIRDLFERCLAHLYQPDRIPLPGDLSLDGPSRTGVLLRNLLIGAFTVMAFSTLALLVAAMLPSGDIPEEDSAPQASSIQQEEGDGSNVFDTLHLAFPDPDQKGKLVIDINRGFIEVTGHDKPEVVIEILNPPDLSASDDSGLQTRFAPNYDLRTDETKNQIKLDTYNQSFVLNLRVKVPFRTDLSLDTYYDGYIHAGNITGTIDAHSEHGDISLLDIVGSATAFSRNGELAIRFRDVAEDAQLDFEGYNGNVDLTLPASLSATVAISSGTGTYKTSFDFESISGEGEAVASIPAVVRNFEEYEFGTINGGGIPIRIENRNGEIIVRKPEL